jgi:hypothetical protein
MTRAQVIAAGLGVAVLAIMLLFPPWMAVTYWSDGHETHDSCDRRFLLARPEPYTVVPELQKVIEVRRQNSAVLYNGPDRYMIDWTRQILPISIVSAIMLSALVLLRRSK